MEKKKNVIAKCSDKALSMMLKIEPKGSEIRELVLREMGLRVAREYIKRYG